MALLDLLKQKKKKAEEYFAPVADKVRVRDVAREGVSTIGKMFSGTKSVAVNAPKIIGEGLAYAIDPNVRKQYTSGNLDILPTVTKMTPRKMLADTAKSALEIAPVGKIRGTARFLMSPSLSKRVAGGAGLGYAYDVADRLSGDEKVSAKTFAPGMGTVAGGALSGVMKPTTVVTKEGIDQVMRGAKETKRIVSQVPTAVRNSIDNRRADIPKEVIPEHWVKGGKASIRSDVAGRPDVIPPLPDGKRYTGKVQPEGMDPVTQSPRFSLQTEKLIPRQEVVRKKTPTVSSLFREAGDLLPQPGLSIKAVKTKADEIIDAEVEVMKDIKANGGVSLVGDPDSVTKTRVSSNPQWYRDFYKVNGRKPNHKEMRKIAKSNLEKGTGYLSAEYREAVATSATPTVPTNKNTQAINAVNERKNAEAAAVVEKMKGATPPKTDPVAEFKKSLDEMTAEPKTGYNRFQQAAYDKKQKRIKSIQEVTDAPNVLRAMGYKKSEVAKMGVEEAKVVAALGKLGYPKGHQSMIDFRSDMTKNILKNGVKYESLQSYYKRRGELNTKFLEGVDPTTLSDIPARRSGWVDVYRNFRDVFGGEKSPVYQKIKTGLLDQFDEAKGNFVSDQEKWLDDIDLNVVKKLGIKKGSKLSAAVQRYGDPSLPEGERLTLEQLKQEFPNDWQKVVEADKWFRSAYDVILDQTNRVREFYFPTHPLHPESTKVIPKRQNYYRHFKEMAEGFKGLLNIFDTPANIDPSLAVSSQYTKPLSKFLPQALQRKGQKTDVDAVGGFLEYLKAAMYAQHIDPHIQRFRGVDKELKSSMNPGDFFPEPIGLAEELSKKIDPIDEIAGLDVPAKIKNILVGRGLQERDAEKMAKDLVDVKAPADVKAYLEKNLTPEGMSMLEPRAAAEESGNKLNNFLKFLDNFANDLAGKTNPIDRPIQDNFFGRQAFRALNWVNSRVKANTILGSTKASLAQFFAIPQGAAEAGPSNTLKGVGRTMLDAIDENGPSSKSNFLKERYFNAYDKFDPGILNRTRDFAVWMTSIGDKIGSTLTWNANYIKAIENGVADPVKYADDVTRRIVGGRGVGEVPIAQKSKVVQVFLPFQYEVGVLWSVFRDWAKEDPKKLALASKMVQYSVYAFVMNRVVKDLRGSDVSFDPLNAMLDAYNTFGEEENNLTGAKLAAGRLAGEVLSNVPGGMTIANMYPEYGKKDIMGTGIDLPTREKFFGDKDPTRFGGGLLASKAVTDPLYMVFPRFGGRQIKDTVEGAKTLMKGYAETAAGKVMTPVDATVENVAKGLLFGKNALNEVQQYREDESTPLGEKETELFKLLGNTPEGKAVFTAAMDRRAAQKEIAKLKSGDVIDGTGVVSDGIYRLSNGKYFSQKTGQSYDSISKAKISVAKDELANSEKNFMVFDNFVLRKNAAGEVSVMPRDNFDSALYSAKLTNAKKRGDVKTWMETADKQFELLNRMIQDPNVDELEKIEIQNRIETLVDQYQRYSSYGGFTKPKQPKEPKMTVAEKYFFDTIAPKQGALRIPTVSRGVAAKRYRFTRPKFNWQKVRV